MAGASGCSGAGQTNYAATAGYDEATGLGSVDFKALAKAWPSSASSANLQSTSLILSPTRSKPSPGEVVAVQISVQPSSIAYPISSVPTGKVSVSVDGTVVNASLPLSVISGIPNPNDQSIAYYNFVAPSTAGSHLLAVTYPGDATHMPATQTIAFLVGNVVASGSFSMAAANLMVANGASGSTQVTVTPNGGYNGRVMWSLSVTGGTSALSGCYSIRPLLVNNVSTAQLTMGVGSACTTALPAARIESQPAGQHAVVSENRRAHHDGTSAVVIYASLSICGLAIGRRRLPSSLLLVLAAFMVACTGLAGCGGGGGGNSAGSSATTPSSISYNVTLTGKDSVNSAITASTNFTLTVN